MGKPRVLYVEALLSAIGRPFTQRSTDVIPLKIYYIFINIIIYKSLLKVSYSSVDISISFNIFRIRPLPKSSSLRRRLAKNED